MSTKDFLNRLNVTVSRDAYLLTYGEEVAADLPGYVENYLTQIEGRLKDANADITVTTLSTHQAGDFVTFGFEVLVTLDADKWVETYGVPPHQALPAYLAHLLMSTEGRPQEPPLLAECDGTVYL